MSDLAEKVKRLRELAAKATPGPWNTNGGEASVFGKRPGYPHASYWVAQAPNRNCPASPDNAQIDATMEYIAAVDPVAVAELLDALERLEGELAAWGANRDRYIQDLHNEQKRAEGLEAELAAVTTPTPDELANVLQAYIQFLTMDEAIDSIFHLFNPALAQHPTPSQGTTP